MHTPTNTTAVTHTHTPDPSQPLAHPYRGPRLRALAAAVELPSFARTMWLATRSALAAVLLSLAVALTSGCGDPADGDAPADAASTPDAPDAPRTPSADVPPVDVQRRDAGPLSGDAAPGTDAAPDAAQDAGALDVLRRDVLVADGADGAPGDATDAPAVDASEPDALAADTGPLVRRCSAASDCPAFPTWTCDGTAGTCRCTPAPSTLPDRCGMRDNDCDGAPDVEALCSTPGGPRCMSTLTSAQHCGGCGRACLPGEGCVGGACRCETPGTGRRSMCGGCADVSVRGPSSDYCTFCRTVCSTTARRSNPTQNTCCNAACGIGTTPDPCR